jgi:hypothetical protein
MPAPDLSKLTVATQAELAFSISHALQFNGRKQFDRARHFMAEITALHLIERLRISGYVVMKRQPAQQHSWSGELDAAQKAKKHLTE